jgi:hypothetical protein
MAKFACSGTSVLPAKTRLSHASLVVGIDKAATSSQRCYLLQSGESLNRSLKFHNDIVGILNSVSSLALTSTGTVCLLI